MQELQTREQRRTSTPRRPPISGRWIFLAAATLTLLLLALLPPLISVNRYGHRISTSISSSLGRPVHFDQVSLNLLPVPSFTITNFVVEEDPAFGAEPMIRAKTVVATLRVSSLWRRPVEFSRINFTEPSLNLVHDSNGKWNVEGILLNAAQIATAPTAQRSPGSTPRFPYIEATGARLNLKHGAEKTPFSLSEADFALWLPDPQAWRMRLRGRPIRTDTNVSDTGSLDLEATLGRGTSLQSLPLTLEGTWRGVPLGEASRLFVAHDLDLRGEMSLTARVRGDLDHNSVDAHLQITGLRRSEFVPGDTISLDLGCTAAATRAFHSFADLRCSWPLPDSDGATLALAGSIPDVLQPASADLQIGTSRLPAAILLKWFRAASSRVPPSLSATGLLSGSILHDPDEGPTWTGQATMPELRLSSEKLGSTPLTISGLFVHSASIAATDLRQSHPALAFNLLQLVLSPVSLPLGGREPALFEGSADANGCTVHLTGTVLRSRLLDLAETVPQIGDGLAKLLPEDDSSGLIRVDLAARRKWNGELTWTDHLTPDRTSTPRPTQSRSRGRRRP